MPVTHVYIYLLLLITGDLDYKWCESVTGCGFGATQKNINRNVAMKILTHAMLYLLQNRNGKIKNQNVKWIKQNMQLKIKPKDTRVLVVTNFLTLSSSENKA